MKRKNKMGLLERIFKYNSLGGEDSTIIDDKKHKIGVYLFGWNVRKGEDMYDIKLRFLFPQIGKSSHYEWPDGMMHTYGIILPTHIKYTHSWGIGWVTIQVLGFGLVFSFQDGNF
jgi:hypothetical protein